MNAAKQRLGVTLPIVQAPVGSVTTPALAAAVSNAGGLGMLAGTWHPPERLRQLIRETRALTSRPFGINLVLAFDPRERLLAALEEGVRHISFFWGDPAPWISIVHATGGRVIHTVGSGEEAAEAAAAGVDVLVAQGVEAGGHVRGTVGRDRLVPAVKRAAGAIPVLAAGGVSDLNDVRNALTAGADGVWSGTRFVASTEASAHSNYKQALVDAAAADTLLCDVFDIGWPDAPHRVIRNSTVRAWEAAGCPPPGSRPGEGDVVARLPGGKPVLRYEDIPPVVGMTGEMEALALYAGESVERITDVMPAADIVRRMSAAFA